MIAVRGPFLLVLLLLAACHGEADSADPSQQGVLAGEAPVGELPGVGAPVVERSAEHTLIDAVIARRFGAEPGVGPELVAQPGRLRRVLLIVDEGLPADYVPEVPGLELRVSNSWPEIVSDELWWATTDGGEFRLEPGDGSVHVSELESTGDAATITFTVHEVAVTSSGSTEEWARGPDGWEYQRYLRAWIR